MDELEKGLSISLSGAARDEALGRATAQLRAWGIALPKVEPLVLDFGLEQFARCGLVEYWIANEFDAGYCAKYLFVFDGQTCPRHRHGQKTETFFLIKGKVKLTCGPEVREMGPGDTLRVRQGEPHEFTGIGPALLLEVSSPCFVDDNYFENAAIPIGGNVRPQLRGGM